MKISMWLGGSALAIAIALLSGCGASNSPEPDKVFDSKSDAEQYALKHYCKADSAEREFGTEETISCENGPTLRVVRIWDAKGNAAGYRLETV